MLYRHSIGCPSTLISPVWNCVCSNPDAVTATQHKSVLSDILYLVPLFSLGSIRTMLYIYISKFFWGKRFASSLGIKESKAPGLWSLLQHHSPKSVLPAFCSGTESFVVSKLSKFLPWIISHNLTAS